MTGRTSTDDTTIQIVEDESKVAELYRLHLRNEHEVRVAETGRAALDRLDESVDVLLVDRRMPGLSGDEFVEEVRERGHDCAIALVSAVDPEIDVVDTAFDAYLVKPLSAEALQRTVEELLTIQEYDDPVRDQYALLQQLTTLKTSGARQGHDDQAYSARIDQLRRCREGTTNAESLVDSTFEPVLAELTEECRQST
ncbi:MAG: response regulator transcription factor [Halolamina sp.]